MAKRGEPCGPARGPLVKKRRAGSPFQPANPLLLAPQSTWFSSRAGWLARKTKQKCVDLVLGTLFQNRVFPFLPKR